MTITHEKFGSSYPRLGPLLRVGPFPKKREIVALLKEFSVHGVGAYTDDRHVQAVTRFLKMSGRSFSLTWMAQREVWVVREETGERA
jgi:hypothetical protein